MKRVLLPILCVLAGTASAAPAQPPSQAGQEQPRFVGSQVCSTCHASAFSDWKSSQHHAAMQVATAETVLGNFIDASFSKDGVTTTFFKRDGKFWVRTDGPDGQFADFEIGYTFGVYPLQQYLIALPGGRLQAFAIAWDTRPEGSGGQRWFHLYPDRSLKAGDPLHWTGLDQNWNYQCAYCHSTNLQKTYNSTQKEFKTTWSELSVGCEACHGPASRHVAWATKSQDWEKYDDDKKGFALALDERRNVKWPMDEHGQAVRSAPRTTQKEIQACAPCHARRQLLRVAGRRNDKGPARSKPDGKHQKSQRHR